MEFNFDESVSTLQVDHNFTGDTINSYQKNTRMPFHTGNDAGNRSQIGYAGPPSETQTRMVIFLIAILAKIIFLPSWSQPLTVPMQNMLSTASHADLLGAQNQAHTKLYEAYIGLKHDILSKT